MNNAIAHSVLPQEIAALHIGPTGRGIDDQCMKFLNDTSRLLNLWHYAERMMGLADGRLSILPQLLEKTSEALRVWGPKHELIEAMDATYRMDDLNDLSKKYADRAPVKLRLTQLTHNGGAYPRRWRSPYTARMRHNRPARKILSFPARQP